MFWNDDDHEGKRLALNNPKTSTRIQIHIHVLFKMTVNKHLQILNEICSPEFNHSHDQCKYK